MATIVQTPGTVTVNQMRQDHNANDDAINDEVMAATAAIAAHKASGNTDHDGRYALDAALTAHKSASDHDGRYYTESEIDAAVVKLTGAQTVAGVKTLTDDPIVKKASPAYILQDASGNNMGKLGSRLHAAAANEIVLYAYNQDTGQFVGVLAAREDGLVYDASGNLLATRKYVQERVGTSFFIMSLSTSVANLANVTDYLRDSTNNYTTIKVPEGAVLRKISYRLWTGSSQMVNAWAEYDCDLVFSSQGYPCFSMKFVWNVTAHTVALYIAQVDDVGGDDGITSANYQLIDTLTKSDLIASTSAKVFLQFEFNR